MKEEKLNKYIVNLSRNHSTAFGSVLSIYFRRIVCTSLTIKQEEKKVCSAHPFVSVNMGSKI